MMELLAERGARLGRARAEARRARLAERMRAAVPPGVEIAVEETAVVLRGRGLARRFAADPALRWLAAESKDGG